MKYMIQTHDLTKAYGDFTAVSHLNLHIAKGRIYGFLGPNGAGKSTTMKMLLGLVRPTSGTFQIDGKEYPKDRNEILRQVGSFIEAPAFYGNLTGEENLRILQTILKLPPSSVDQALKTVGLYQFRRRQAKKYSLGMKQRLGLAGALLGQPPILILDEPTNGLDPFRDSRDPHPDPFPSPAVSLHGAGILSSALGNPAYGGRCGHPQSWTLAV